MAGETVEGALCPTRLRNDVDVTEETLPTKKHLERLYAQCGIKVMIRVATRFKSFLNPPAAAECCGWICLALQDIPQGGPPEL